MHLIPLWFQLCYPALTRTSRFTVMRTCCWFSSLHFVSQAHSLPFLYLISLVLPLLDRGTQPFATEDRSKLSFTLRTTAGTCLGGDNLSAYAQLGYAQCNAPGGVLRLHEVQGAAV